MTTPGKKGILLLSEGIDSPVAGWMMKERGMELIFLHMQNRPEDTEKIQRLASLIDKKAKLMTIDHSRAQERISASCRRRFQCLLCKREMYRQAEDMATRYGCSFIITGENLGQVASQSLQNLYVLDQAVQMPVLRPLLGSDKKDIVAKAKDIGTYDISTAKSKRCPYVPKDPATKAGLDQIKAEEKRWRASAII